MEKGRFLMNMAKEHPLVNFVGIERYSSVLLRALEKYDTEEYKDLQNITFPLHGRDGDRKCFQSG